MIFQLNILSFQISAQKLKQHENQARKTRRMVVRRKISCSDIPWPKSSSGVTIKRNKNQKLIFLSEKLFELIKFNVNIKNSYYLNIIPDKLNSKPREEGNNVPFRIDK